MFIRSKANDYNNPMGNCLRRDQTIDETIVMGLDRQPNVSIPPQIQNARQVNENSSDCLDCERLNNLKESNLQTNSVSIDKTVASKKEDIPKSREQLIVNFTSDGILESEARAGPFDRDFMNCKYEIPLLYFSQLNDLTLNHNDFQLSDSELYYGSVDPNGRRHGYGVLLTKEGVKYEGYWNYDAFEPYGRYIYNDIILREGPFTNGLLNGKGMESTKLYNYIGDFMNSIKEGKGVMRSDRELYIGEFKQNQKNGYGRMQYLREHNEYEGEFSDGKIHGHGKFKWKATGDSYEGQFKKNLIHGIGEYTWNNGDKYIGQFSKGIRTGSGKIVLANGDTIEI